MENPFESGHIKNYILFYVSIVVIMVLFFIASTLFHDVENIDKKVFNTKTIKDTKPEIKENKEEENSLKSRLKLLDKAY